MSRLLTCLALAAAAGPAAACINDVELPAHEREFRSQYRSPAAPPASPQEPASRPGTGLLLGAGGMLLAGAVVLTLNSRRQGH